MSSKKTAKHIDYEDSQKIARAKNFMILKYNGQVRPNGDKYYIHPLDVCMHLREYNYGIDHQIAGLFHDLLKNTNTTLEEIKRYSNNDVEEAIRILTLSKGEFISQQYINVIKQNDIALPVSLVDRLEKLYSIVSNKLGSTYREIVISDTKIYFEELFKSLPSQSPVAEDYCRVMNKLHEKKII